MTQEELQRMFQEKMNGGQQQQSSLTRQPSVKELDEFIDRCCKEKEEVLYSLGQALNFKISKSYHSVYEGEILPLVLQRIQQRLNKGEV